MILEGSSPEGGVGTLVTTSEGVGQVTSGFDEHGYLISGPGGGSGGVSAEELATELEGLAALLRGNSQYFLDLGDVEENMISLQMGIFEVLSTMGQDIQGKASLADLTEVVTKTVRLDTNQTITGQKYFTGWMSTRDLQVQNNPGDTARIVLFNSDAAQAYEFGVNTGGVWSVWNSTDGVGPFRVYAEAVDGALTLGAGTNWMEQDLDMDGNSITSVATPVNPNDAATKAYVDAAIAAAMA
ncbi:hypothetical protein ASE48_08445 [Mycobacterium sp. Root265]|uniref:hypothetical protein n=1 Tax=Mycobacterium sp. Root265 TaxID=1736504 RepID=UPI00070E5640|nr:hypothetical protein [Mycobacterium sp. Root265]KRD08583.1 hypothetical protein ASE48_08445 [Mycobacterium sp. Root265]